MATLKPIRKNIVFTFNDSFDGKQFVSTTESGIIIRSFDNSLQEARLCTVQSVGDEVENVKPGDVIMVEPLKWTTNFDVDGNTVWLTTEEHVLFVIDK